MDITIKPEDIDQYVKEAILKSTVGQTLTIEIEKGIQEVMNGYNSPVKRFMCQILEKYVQEYMDKPEVKEKCLEAITRTITPEVVQKIVLFGVEELTRRFNSVD